MVRIRIYPVPMPKTKNRAKGVKRDIYAMFSSKFHVPSDMSVNEIRKKSSVIVESGKTDKGYVFHIHRKSKRFAFIHPVIMDRDRRR